MGTVIGCVNAGIFLFLSLLHIFDCRPIKPQNSVFHQASYLADIIFDRALLRELKTSRVGCASTCHIHPKCKSYFYNKEGHVCRTHSTIFTDNVGSIPASGWHYYGRHAASVQRKLVPAKQMQTGGPVTTPSPGLSSLFKFAQNATTPLPVTDVTDDDSHDNYQGGSGERATTDPARGGTTKSPPEVTSSLVTENPGRTREPKTTSTDGPEGRTKESKEKASSKSSSHADDSETTKGPKGTAVDLDVSTSTVDKVGEPAVGEINPAKPTDGVDTVTVHPRDVETKGGTTLANNVDPKTVRHEFETTDSGDIRESERTGMDDIQESQTTDSMGIQEPERTNPSGVQESGVISTNGKAISDRTGVVNTHDVSLTTEGSRSAPTEHALPTGVEETSASIHSYTSVSHDEDLHDELSFLTTQEQNAILELGIGVTVPGTTLPWDDGDGSEGLTVVGMVGDDEDTRAPATTFTVDPSVESSIQMTVTDAGLYSDDDDDDRKINTNDGFNSFDDDDQDGLQTAMDLTNLMTTTLKQPPDKNDADHVTKSPPYDLTKEQSVFDKILHKPTERPPYSSEPVAVRVVAVVVVVVVVCLAGSGVYAWYVRRRTGSFNILKKSEDGLGLQLITSTR